MADRTSARLFGELFTKLAELRQASSSNRASMAATEIDLLDDLVAWVWDQTGGYDFSPYQMDCDEVLKELGLMRPAQDEYEYGPARGQQKETRR
jgi:hypothetical protein